MKIAKLLGMLALGMNLSAGDPAIGTWKLNVAISKYTPGPPPMSATITYEESADGIKRTSESVDAEGKTTCTTKPITTHSFAPKSGLQNFKQN